MSETKDATGGFRRITRLGPTVQIKLFGFVLVIVCGTVLVTWVTSTTWNQLERLQKEHAAVKSESFYMGVTLRSAVRSLNSKLLQFGLEHNQSAREAFLKEASDLQGWIETNQAHLAEVSDLHLLRSMGLQRDLALLREVEKSYQSYLKETAAVLAAGKPPPDLDTFEEVYARVQDASRQLLGRCDELVAVQRQGFGEFLAETQRTLANHHRLLKISSGLILALALSLAILVYRGMIAPLRLGLTQSRTIIERQEKLASLGVLASGVAHEIRNPLTAIKFRLFSLRKALPALAHDEDTTVIASEINRLERIVKDFLQFARPSEPELTTLPAERLLRDVERLMHGQLERTGIRLQVESGDSALVHADPQQLKQVLINLVQNAAEAVGHDGTITLRVRRETTEFDGRPQASAIVSVADSGRGIAPEVEARLFDPFFTTKEGGTGLGLAIAARIVEKHGGILRYETQLNRGTTFELVLPLTQRNGSENITN